MISYPVIYPTALQFWLQKDYLELIQKLNSKPREHIDFSQPAGFYMDQELAEWISSHYGLPLPLSLAAPDASMRRSNQHYISTMPGFRMLPRAFAELTRIKRQKTDLSDSNLFKVCIAGPELCFLQAARELSFLQLVKLGYDLCAVYVKDPLAAPGQINRTPATCADDIRQFLSHADGVTGVQAARKAAAYILDRSNSPMETFLAILMILPFSEGGFFVRKPEMNAMVPLSKAGKEILGRDSCMCDFFWREEKVIVEYESKQSHLNTTQLNKDRRRLTALTESGYVIIYLTPENIRSEYAIEASLVNLRKVLGLHSRRKYLEKFRVARRKLIDDLWDLL